MVSRISPTIVLIGAGGIARTYAQVFADHLHFQIAGVADIRLSAAEELATLVGARAFDDVESMVVELQPTAAIVCTPPATHAAICIELMNLGIHVLCEKPLAISSHDARRMIRAGETNNVVFTMGSQFRFADDVQETRRLIESGILGDIVLFQNTFAENVDMSQRWNSDIEVSGGGVLIDRGPHSVDIMRFLLGAIIDLQVVEGRRIQFPDVEDTVRLFVRSESGAAGSIDLSWSMDNAEPHFISIYGSHGILQVGWQESKYRCNGDDNWTVFGNGYNEIAAYRGQLLNFVDAIHGAAELVISPTDALASVMTIETAYHALRTEEWHPVRQIHRQWSRPGAGKTV